MNKTPGTLSKKQKQELQSLKEQIIDQAITILSIQDITTQERGLIRKALAYIALDLKSDYAGRMAELNTYLLMIKGILVNHLDSKQIRYGTARPIDIAPILPSENHKVTSDLFSELLEDL